MRSFFEDFIEEIAIWNELPSAYHFYASRVKKGRQIDEFVALAGAWLNDVRLIRFLAPPFFKSVIKRLNHLNTAIQVMNPMRDG